MEGSNKNGKQLLRKRRYSVKITACLEPDIANINFLIVTGVYRESSLGYLTTGKTFGRILELLRPVFRIPKTFKRHSDP